MSTCEECRSKQKKYRVMQNDHQFQMKKQREDLAIQKVKLQQSYQKQLKNFKQKSNKQKNWLEQQNKQWIQKYDEMVMNYKNQIESIHTIYQTKLKKLEAQLKQEYQNKQKRRQKQHMQTIQKMKNHQSSSIKSLRQQQREEIARIKQKQTQNINGIKQTYELKLSSLFKQNQANIKQLKRQIFELSESCDNIKKEASFKQKNLYDELYLRRQQISDLKYQIQNLNHTVLNQKDQIKLLNLQIKQMTSKYNKEKQSIKNEFQKDKQYIHIQYKQKIKDLLKKKLQDCENFEVLVKDIDTKRENQQKIYVSNLKQVQQLVEVRPSKQEDIEQINQLRLMLNQKEKEFRKAQQEAKGFRLELSNKEETLNRIFTAGSPQNAQNPFNIQKISRKRDLRNYRSSHSALKDHKIAVLNTMHNLPLNTKGSDLKKATGAISSKFF